MGQDHLDNIVINISLDSPPSTGVDFFFPLLIADQATGTTLNGDRVRTYSDPLDLSTDETAGFLSAAIAQAGRDALSQIPRPSRIKIGRRDSGGGESYPDAFTEIRLIDDAFYTTAIESRADADILLMGAAIEPVRRKLSVSQSDETTFKTSGFPAGLAAIDGNERTIICWHEDDTEFMDFAYTANRLAFDPNLRSVPWAAGVKAVESYATALTQGEKDFLDANKANNGLAFGGEPFYVDPGVTASGRPIYEIVTADWFEASLQTRVASLKASRSAKGQKVPVDGTGQGLMLNIVNSFLDQGEAAGHFVAGSAREVLPVPITDADRAAQRMRFTGQAQLSVDGRLFTFDLVFTRNPIVVAAT